MRLHAERGGRLRFALVCILYALGYTYSAVASYWSTLLSRLQVMILTTRLYGLLKYCTGVTSNLRIPK